MKKMLPWKAHVQKWVLAMLCLMLCIAPLTAQPSEAPKVSIQLENVTTEALLAELENQTNFHFAYNKEAAFLFKKVSMHARELPLEEVLRKLSERQGLSYKTINNTIWLKAGTSRTIELIKGKIVDAEDNSPLVGASVVVKGTSIGTISDVNGEFRLANVEQGVTLLVSYIGYEAQEIEVNSETLHIALKSNTRQLQEVVVGALGIERETYSLGYAVQKVGDDDISEVRSGNWVNTLKGKVAGLNFTNAGTGPAGTTRITLRGENTLNFANNEAMIVVDGIPVNSGMTGNGEGSYLGEDLPVDYGDGISDLNPDDIQSISVLKGPTAAALYGSRAMNGVIMITTKTAKKNKKLGVNFSTSFTLDKINRWPDYQTEYGSGSRTKNPPLYYSFGKTEDGKGTQSTHSWGPGFEGQDFYQYPDTDVRTAWQARDHVKGFFEEGTTVNHNLSVSGAGEMGSMRLSLSHLKNDWIVPNTGFEKNSIALNTTFHLNKYIKIKAQGSYIKKKSDNLPAAGYGSHSPMYFFMWNTNNIDVNWLKDYWLEENVLQDNATNPNADNPYFQSYEQIDSQEKDRVIGMVSAHIQATDEIDLMLRTGLDQSEDFRRTIRPMSSIKFPRGMYREQTVFYQENNSDFLASYKPKWEEFEFKASVGGNYRKLIKRNYKLTAKELNIPGVYNLGNATTMPVLSNSRYRHDVYSLYALLSLGRKWWYLDLTARNDWSSTLPQSHNSFFYPSASLSLLVSEMVDLGAVDLLKVRLSAAQVGNDTRPYKLERYYSYSEFNASVYNPSTIPNSNLLPEQVTSYEAGVDLRMFKGRLNFDATVYHSQIHDQIIDIPIDPSSGYKKVLLNAGQINNTGLELTAGFSAIRTEKFQWKTNINWATNRGKVVELADGVENYIMADGIYHRVTVEARPGERLGDIYGRGYKRAPSGEIIYEDGMPVLDTEIKKVGNAFPDWTGGLYNEFTYKGFRLGVLFDVRKGGDLYSLTYAALSYSGKLTNSLEGRYDQNLIGKGVIDMGDGTYKPNDQQPDNIGYYYNALYSRDNVEANTVDGSFVKLREVSLGWNLPKKWLQNMFIDKASVSLSGRNLFTWSDYPAFDPEAATMDGSSIRPGFETGQYPSTASYTLKVNLSF
ncbi:SusC/RagA family TonB-linked outer membrane protein [Rapidithrix thailandica]|uniref:SusC/RagA family TonB-linked outer membrane protein n=1 Tax=Rapidithrix thailandica TaxID=413964 RepID=A0AAW9SBF6_9BACT